ncbi:hypothetical protein CEXT_34091 [Caerostris extrusa]|uniref:Uncharacterized protein n=1 Tax=Caerostris extrusa TaxID=172846 RepID=A0AAV4NZP2_CAEEX|nr:hypothetical protein CEXT_34091 [Caerostris extrusa]
MRLLLLRYSYGYAFCLVGGQALTDGGWNRTSEVVSRGLALREYLKGRWKGGGALEQKNLPTPQNPFIPTPGFEPQTQFALRQQRRLQNAPTAQSENVTRFRRRF